ncbi:MAG: hypothetical protein COT84_01105 [Chlamydiae bacterium CG10_big_fil_rev_8_21_14_0_10_35_9]|nr:MAG: hypothetical protein COT84_01105 [Chlamydiae bacterium CG10_big_fil_rev_8_21_14_0_10_35_9]
MKDEITSFFSKKLRHTFDSNTWESLFLFYVDKKVFPKQQITNFIESEFASIEKTPILYYQQLKKLCSLLIFTRGFPYSYDDLFEGLVKRILEKKFPPSFQPIYALQSLISYHYYLQADKFDPVLHNSGMSYFNIEGGMSDLLMPNIKHNYELIIFWVILGVLKNDQNLLEKSQKLFQWQKRCLDKSGNPIKSIWSSPYNLQDDSALLLHQLVSGHIHEIDQLSFSYFPYFEIAISLWFLEVRSNFSKGDLFNQSFNLEEDPASVFIDQNGLKGLMTLRGVNSGFGYMEKDDFAIVSFGPELLPTKEKRGYGIYRACPLKRNGFDNIIKSDSYIRGWAPLSCFDQNSGSTAYPSDVYIEFEGKFDLNKFVLNFNFYNLGKSQTIGFSFFTKASSCEVVDVDFLKSSDSQKICSKSNKIFFYSSCQKILFQTKNFTNLIVSPKNKYWNENFHLTYFIKGDNPTLNVEIVL